MINMDFSVKCIGGEKKSKDDTSRDLNIKVSSERESSINEAICFETRPAARFLVVVFCFFEIANQPWQINHISFCKTQTEKKCFVILQKY